MVPRAREGGPRRRAGGLVRALGPVGRGALGRDPGVRRGGGARGPAREGVERFTSGVFRETGRLLGDGRGRVRSRRSERRTRERVGGAVRGRRRGRVEEIAPPLGGAPRRSGGDARRREGSGGVRDGEVLSGGVVRDGRFAARVPNDDGRGGGADALRGGVPDRGGEDPARVQRRRARRRGRGGVPRAQARLARGRGRRSRREKSSRRRRGGSGRRGEEIPVRGGAPTRDGARVARRAKRRGVARGDDATWRRAGRDPEGAPRELARDARGEAVPRD